MSNISNTAAAIANTTVIAVPAPLNAGQLADLDAAQNDERAVFNQGTAYQRTRAIAYLNRHNLVASIGAEALAYHVEKKMDYKVSGIRKGVYQICAMGLLQLDVLRETDKSAKADANNRINDLRRALEGFNHFATEIAGMTEDEFVKWFAKMGGLDGIYEAVRRANPVEVEPVRDEKKISAAIDGMISNTNAVEVDNPHGTTGLKLFVARGEGKKLRLVPLDASADFIATLSARAPDPMTNAPSRVVFFRELLLTSARIVPDAMSKLPKKKSRPGEKVTANTEMLPANQIIRVKDGKFSVAGSRVEDTVVVEVLPNDEALARSLAGEGFIDTITRKNMLARLEPTTSAAGITGVVISDVETKSGAEVRVSFERGENNPDGQLLVKGINRMGGLYTWGVKDFTASASATMDEAARTAFNDNFLAAVLKSREDHAITVGIDAKGVSFKLGSASTARIKGQNLEGSETVRVKKVDFVRAVDGLLALPLEGDLVWSIDTRGLLCIEASTASATYKVYVQILRKETDPKAQNRERALLQLIERAADLAAAA